MGQEQSTHKKDRTNSKGSRSKEAGKTDSSSLPEVLEKATVGAGCFWCIEALFQRVKGVVAVESGFAGGDNPEPTYKQVSSGKSGHAEVVQVTYNANEINYEQIIRIFFRLHDPTSLNKQGNDTGPQYRSVIFYHDENQREIAEKVKDSLERDKHYIKPIVTEITPVKNYSKADSSHQSFFNKNNSNSYCRLVIIPKLEKFEKIFAGQTQKSV